MTPLTDINWFLLIITITGGLSVFLMGMNMMTESLKNAAGHKLKTFLEQMTSNRFSSLAAGTVITAIIQSSSAVTVIAVGLVSAGLLTFPKTLGLILGANVGTTITAQIIALKVTKYSLFIITMGFLISISTKKNIIVQTSKAILGLGLIFLGMQIMSEGSYPLRNYEPFLNMMKNINNPLFGIIIGAVFTAIVQSSSATTGIVIIMAADGFINLEASVTIVIGANIGTCITALISAIGRPRAALQVALSHIIFNLTGALMWIPFISNLSGFVSDISNGNLTRQIANAHTIFNIANALLFIGFTEILSKFIQKIIPNPVEHKVNKLDDYYLTNIPLALSMVETALEDLSKKTLNLIHNTFTILIHGNMEELQQIRKMDEGIDNIHKSIISYLHQISQKELTKKEFTTVKKQLRVSSILESAGDLITTDFVESAEHRIDKNFELSPKTLEKLQSLYENSLNAFQNSVKAYFRNDEKMAKAVIRSKSEFKRQSNLLHEHLAGRLMDNDTHRIEILRLEQEMLEISLRLHGLARTIARMSLIQI